MVGLQLTSLVIVVLFLPKVKMSMGYGVVNKHRIAIDVLPLLKVRIQFVELNLKQHIEFICYIR